MDADVPGSREVERQSDPHGWNSYDQYLNIEQSRLDNHPFVLSHNLRYDFYEYSGETYLRISGQVVCLNNVLLEVEKYLETRRTRPGVLLVRTFSYRYNASVRGKGNVLRYDNGHDSDEYHRHVFDLETGEQAEYQLLDRFHFPTFPQILDELEEMFSGK